MKSYEHTLSRLDAIKILEKLTDQNDPYWENATEDYYDEKNDSMPNIAHVLSALGITKEEYALATGINISHWPRPSLI